MTRGHGRAGDALGFHKQAYEVTAATPITAAATKHREAQAKQAKAADRTEEGAEEGQHNGRNQVCSHFVMEAQPDRIIGNR